MRVDFIMPMPGSQRMNSLEFAYALHSIRWIIRIALTAILVYQISTAWRKHPIITTLLSVVLIGSIYLTNFPMSADTMFKQMSDQNFANHQGNQIDTNRLIIGVILGNQAKAYPINIIAHHHQVKDKLNDQNIMVTYCSFCRTGRVYNPMLNGKLLDFRLVGMDHFNAMFEDSETKSWWRQVNGTCVTGKLKGQKLNEIECYQTTLKTWLKLYPQSLILQEDAAFKTAYKALEKFDDGTIKSSLIGRDKKSDAFKSWVLWIKNKNEIKKIDWTEIERKQYEVVELKNSTCLVLSNDKQSCLAFDISQLAKKHTIKPPQWNIKVTENYFEITDTLNHINSRFNYLGKAISVPVNSIKIDLPKIQCTQEFKHSFDQFHDK